MKTKTFVPSFYLFSDELTIKVDKKIRIGREEGDVVVDDDVLSSVHCEITPRLLDVSIRDLNSLNGVYVNQTKIFPDEDVHLNPGDRIRIGSTEYFFFNNEAEYRKKLPKVEKRKHPRPDNLYGIKNFINFYCAHPIWRFFYFLVMITSVVVFMMNLELNAPLPQHLEFMKEFYSKNIYTRGTLSLFFAYSLSLLHSFLMALYFNRNPVRQLFTLPVYVGLIFFSVDILDGPLGKLKRYLIARGEIHKEVVSSEKRIIRLNKLMKSQASLASGLNFMAGKLPPEQYEVLMSDYKKNKKLLDKQLVVLEKGTDSP